MKILLDNCVDVRVPALFPGHEVTHAKDRGWQRLTNGRLIAQGARAGFEVLVTVDKRIRKELKLRLDKFEIPVVELNTLFVTLEDLRTIAPFFDAALAATKTHRFVSIAADGTLELLAARASPT